MSINSIRFKASILYSAVLAIILILFSIAIFVSARTILYDDFDNNLKIKAEEIAGILKAYKQLKKIESHPLGIIMQMLGKGNLDTSQKIIIDNLWKSELETLNLKNDYINILNVKGRAVVNSYNLTKELSSLFNSQMPFSIENVFYHTITTPQGRIRAINLPIKLYETTVIIQVGSSIEPVWKLLRRLLTFIILAVVLLLILTSFVGKLFAQRILKPVLAVSRMADKITHKDLSGRVSDIETDEEMKQLVLSFNSMIGRLEKSFAHINDFSSHVAHELKTPLAIMRGEIELILGHPQNTDGDYQKVLTDNLDEIDRMIKIVKDLLLLAKLDYKPEIFKFEKLNLCAMIDDIYAHSQVLASSKNITMTMNCKESAIYISGDSVHLRRLFLNLINNAVQYTPSDGNISIQVNLEHEHVVVEIIDTGEGISPKHLSKIFEKFYRIPKDTENREPGSGLGLNIALSIARAHQGDISVESQLAVGTTFKISLPLI